MRFLPDSQLPLVDKSNITFLYRGEADEVFLRCWIAGLDTAQPLRRLPETDLWTASIALPEGSRIEYKFEVVRGDDREFIVDPLNPVQARDPFGANSVCQAYGYERPDWTHPDPEARPGSIEQHRIVASAFGDQRDIAVYLPARFRSNRRYSAPRRARRHGLPQLRGA